jgi:predicted nucleic acid-binding protein
VDASPLIALADIGQLVLLPDLFGRIFVPPTVDREASRVLRPSGTLLAWIDVRAPRPDPMLTALRRQLDPGEAEALALALERRLFLVIDDAAGRRRATALGIPWTGTLGILQQAKEAGLIDLAKPLALDLRAHGLWMSDELLQRFLELVGET